MRANKGEGGALAQLANVGDAIQKPAVQAKPKTSGLPPGQPSNPMAPKAQAVRTRTAVVSTKFWLFYQA